MVTPAMRTTAVLLGFDPFKFPYLPVSALCSLPIANFTPLRLLCSNSLMISWRPSTLVKLQFQLLSTCLRHSILSTTPHFFTDLSIPLVCPALSFPGFAPILQIAPPLLKLTRHPHPPQQYPQVCPRALSSAHFFLFFSYHLLPM